MAVKIRLTRRGRKKLALYDLVIADSRSPRDGRFIEKLGTYNPLTNPASIIFDEERAFQWLMKGAQPTDTVRAMLSNRGILLRKHLQVGVLKGALSQEEADRKFEEWKANNESKILAKMQTLAKARSEDAKVRREAETRVREARIEAIKKKLQVQESEEVEVESTAEAAEAAPAETTGSAGEAPRAPVDQANTSEAAEPAPEPQQAGPAPEATGDSTGTPSESQEPGKTEEDKKE